MPKRKGVAVGLNLKIWLLSSVGQFFYGHDSHHIFDIPWTSERSPCAAESSTCGQLNRERNIRSSGQRALWLLLPMVLGILSAASPVIASPTRTQCKQWDDAFLSVFNIGFVVVLILTALSFTGLLGRLGRFWWAATAPRWRIFLVSAFIFVLAVILIPLGPQVVGLGKWWFSGVDPQYVECKTMRFGAEGLLGGQIGEGVAAIAQPYGMIILYLGAASLGGIIAWRISDVLSKRSWKKRSE